MVFNYHNYKSNMCILFPSYRYTSYSLERFGRVTIDLRKEMWVINKQGKFDLQLMRFIKKCKVALQ